MPAEWIWKNGEFVKWEDATVHVTTHALHYGSSVFEGIRAYATPQGPAVFRLQPHTRRLLNSAKIARMEVPYTRRPNQRGDPRNGPPQRARLVLHPPAGLSRRGSARRGRTQESRPMLIIFTMEWGRYLGAGRD